MTDNVLFDTLRGQLPALLAELPGDDPAGCNVRHDPDFASLREAREVDDPSLPAGIWQTELKSADWRAAQSLASELLSTRGKDLLVAAWLGEAWTQRYHLPGLCVALEMLAALCERYNNQLYPRTEGDDESWLASPLSWLIREYSEILHIHLPLMGNTVRGFESLTLEQWAAQQQQAQSKSDERRAQASTKSAQALMRQLREALGAMPASGLHQHIALVKQCSTPLDQLDRWCDAHLKRDAPSFAALRNMLARHTHALQEILAMHPDPQPIAPAPVTTEPSATASTEAPAALPTAAQPLGAPESRQEAYRQLQLISDYLARIEPHSPVPYLINRAIDWGHKPLRELLGELVNADADTRRIWTVLGVLP